MSDLTEAPKSATKKRHGRACVRCATAKTKCLPTAESATRCERCHQMRKECITQTPVPRKRKAGPPTTTRVTQLEQKIEGLVALLSSTQHASEDAKGDIEDSILPDASGLDSRDAVTVINSTGQESAGGANGNDIQFVETVSAESPLVPHAKRIRMGVWRDGILGPQSVKPQSVTATPTDCGPAAELGTTPSSTRTLTAQLDDYEAEHLLQIFRDKMVPYFPFVVVQPDKTAKELREEKPFLWKVIAATACSRDLERQESMMREVMEHITSILLLHPGKNLEVLQGLLIFSAWNYYQFPYNGQMTNLLYLAKALTINLGLDRVPGSVDRRALFMNGNPMRCPKYVEVQSHTSDEQRALLGCYYVCSAKGQLGTARIDTLQYTPYMQRCCEILQANQEHPSDILLVSVVRLQNVIENIVQTFPREEPQIWRSSKTPVGVCVKALQQELAEIKSSLPPELDGNPLFHLGYHAAELSIYEVALYDVPADVTHAATTAFNLDKIGLLYGCLVSLISYFDIYTALSKSQYQYFPFLIWMQSGLALLTALELSFLQQDGWDVGRVRDSLNLVQILDREIEYLHDVAEDRGTIQRGWEKRDIFWLFAERIKKMKTTYDTHLALESAPEEIQQTETAEPIDGVIPDNLFAGIDESFWQTIMNDQWDGMGISA